MPNTHCLPTGSLGTGELAINNITPGTVTALVPSGGLGHGNIRGIVVSCHGLTGPGNAVPPIPYLTDYLTFAQNLQADGWIVVQPPYPEDFKEGDVGINTDISNDAGFGSRYLNNTTIRWWDHVNQFITATYQSGLPTVVFGVSWGGWHVFQIAAAHQSSLLAMGCHVPVSVVSNLSNLFSPPVNYGLINTSGADVSTTLLNSITIPAVVGYATNDIAVGYSGVTTVDVGSDGTAASAVTTLSVVSNTGFILNPGPMVTITGLTGGTGRATFTFTGTGSGTLTGATLISGSGTLHTGNPVQQSTTSALIANQQAAQPSHQITANSTTSSHQFTSTEATYYTNWFTTIVDPLAPKLF